MIPEPTTTIDLVHRLFLVLVLAFPALAALTLIRFLIGGILKRDD